MTEEQAGRNIHTVQGSSQATRCAVDVVWMETRQRAVVFSHGQLAGTTNSDPLMCHRIPKVSADEALPHSTPAERRESQGGRPCRGSRASPARMVRTTP